MKLTHKELPGLDNLDAEAAQYLNNNARQFEIPIGEVVFQPGKACADFLWLAKGCLRVQMVGINGREIVLYRVTPGESCIMTTSCLLSGDSYNAEAIVEENVIGIAISKTQFDHLLAISALFRETVFASFGTRVGELLKFIEEVSFSRLDQRLVNYICANAHDNAISITHEALARELSTHREVVSRLLKEFERKGYIELGHGKINLLKLDALNSIKNIE